MTRRHCSHEYMPLIPATCSHVVVLILHPLIDALVQGDTVMAQSVTSEDRGPMIDRVSIAVYAVAVLFVALR